jgi:hypothetical protein
MMNAFLELTFVMMMPGVTTQLDHTIVLATLDILEMAEFVIVRVTFLVFIDNIKHSIKHCTIYMMMDKD